jgi:hypothetical protein
MVNANLEQWWEVMQVPKKGPFRDCRTQVREEENRCRRTMEESEYCDRVCEEALQLARIMTEHLQRQSNKTKPSKNEHRPDSPRSERSPEPDHRVLEQGENLERVLLLERLEERKRSRQNKRESERKRVGWGALERKTLV